MSISKPPTLRKAAKDFKTIAQHYLNPLHVMTALCNNGVSYKEGCSVGRRYGKKVFPYIKPILG